METVDSVKLLGVTLQANCRWLEHINNISSRCSKAMYMVSTLSRINAPPHIVWLCYTSCVLTIMSYAWPCFCDASDSTMKRLVTLDKRAHMLAFKPYVATLRQRLDKQCIKMAKQLTSDHPLSIFFQKRDLTAIKTRNQCAYTHQIARTELFRQSFIKFYSSITNL